MINVRCNDLIILNNYLNVDIVKWANWAIPVANVPLWNNYYYIKLKSSSSGETDSA